MKKEEKEKSYAIFKAIVVESIQIIGISFLIIVISALISFIVRLGFDWTASKANLSNVMTAAFSILSAVVSCVTLSRLIYVQRQDNKKQEILQKEKIKAANKDTDLREAEFLLKYNQAFIQDRKMTEIEKNLERNLKGETLNITDENRQDYINYLVYLEGLAPLILKGILRLETIDDLMAYRYFIAVNNIELQDKELCKDGLYYKGCFKIYEDWEKYRKENDEPIPGDGSPNYRHLNKHENFYEIKDNKKSDM